MVLSQLTFEKHKFIGKCYWKPKNMTRAEAVEKWIWNLVLVVEILNICDFNCKIL